MDESMKEINLKFALKANPTMKLKELLNLYDFDDLKLIYSYITNKNIYGKKEKLINKVYSILTNEEILHNTINNFIEKELDELKDLIRNKGDITNSYLKIHDYIFLQKNGIVFKINYNDEVHIIIPQDILDVLNNMNINKYYEQIRKNTKVFELLNSCINLYGTIEKDYFLELCYKYYKIDKCDINYDSLFMNHLNYEFRVSSLGDSKQYFLKQDDLIEDVENIKLLARVTDYLYDFSYKEIELDELLQYNDLYFCEDNKYIRDFIKYFENKKIINLNANELIETIINTFRREYYEGIIFLEEMFDDYNIKLDEDNLDEIMSLINNCVNSIPLWGNKGWSNNEIILGKNI